MSCSGNCSHFLYFFYFFLIFLISMCARYFVEVLYNSEEIPYHSFWIGKSCLYLIKTFLPLIFIYYTIYDYIHI